MDSIATVVVSAIVGAVVAFVGAYTQKIIDARGVISQEVRNERQAVYQTLWKNTELLPMFPKNSTATYRQLHNLTRTCRDWYFREGGIYLSEEAQRAYRTAQKIMCDAVNAKPTELDTPLSDADYESSRSALSALRTELTKDLASRKRTPFSG